MSRSITRFEQLAYLGLFLAVAQAPLELIRATGEIQGSPVAVGAAKTISILGEFLGILIGWLPIWLIARRRQSWARWLFVIVYFVALGFFISNYGKSGRLFDVMNGTQAVLWGLAMCFLFTRGARDWLWGEEEELAAATAASEPVAVRAPRSVAPTAPVPPPKPAAKPKPQPAPMPKVAPKPAPKVEPTPRPVPVPARPAEAAAPGRTRMRVAAGRRVVVAPAELSHHGKVDAHVLEVAKAGVNPYVSSPPLFRLLWAWNLAVPPPLFLGFIPIIVMAWLPFMLVWLLLNALAGFMGTLNGLVVGAWLGLAFGALLAAYYRRTARRLALPAWEHYLPARS
jgi:hypothetical protein